MQPPNLDDRSFADLVAEIRARIPRYAPEWQWNDFNDADPGITFAQLYAWLFGTVLYRFNRVPDAMQVKFLQLLGVEPRPAQPARTQLTFTLARDDIAGVHVPRGTQVAAAGGEGEPPVFETDETIFALGARLAAVVTADGVGLPPPSARRCPRSAVLRIRAAGAARQRAAARPGLAGRPARRGAPAHLRRARPADTRAVTCGDAAGGPTAAVLAWEFWDGARWAPLNVYRDATRALTRTGHVHVSGPGAAARRSVRAGVEEEAFWLRARVASDGYEQAPQLEAVLLNTVAATQAMTVRDEVVGGSTGQPHQRFQLSQTSLVEPLEPERSPCAGRPGRRDPFAAAGGRRG
jgi:predicted phage baseplate assembly protein